MNNKRLNLLNSYAEKPVFANHSRYLIQIVTSIEYYVSKNNKVLKRQNDNNDMFPRSGI